MAPASCKRSTPRSIGISSSAPSRGLAQGPGTGPALLFNKIRDYGENSPLPSGVCRRAVELPAHRHDARAAARHASARAGQARPHHPHRQRSRRKSSRPGRSRRTSSKATTSILYDFPAPQWNRADGGRYILTYGGVVTKDPNTNVMNVGVYRGMVAGKNMIPMLTWRAQHIGHHATAWQQTRPQRNADRGRHRLGAVARFRRRRAGAEKPVRIRRHRRHPRRAGGAGQMRDRRSLRAGQRRDRHRRFHELRSGDLLAGRPVRRVHRLYRRRPLAEIRHPRHLHHPPQESDPARHHRRHDAGQLFGEQRHAPR